MHTISFSLSISDPLKRGNWLDWLAKSRLYQEAIVELKIENDLIFLISRDAEKMTEISMTALFLYLSGIPPYLLSNLKLDGKDKKVTEKFFEKDYANYSLKIDLLGTLTVTGKTESKSLVISEDTLYDFRADAESYFYKKFAISLIRDSLVYAKFLKIIEFAELYHFYIVQVDKVNYDYFVLKHELPNLWVVVTKQDTGKIFGTPLQYPLEKDGYKFDPSSFGDLYFGGEAFMTAFKQMLRRKHQEYLTNQSIRLEKLEAEKLKIQEDSLFYDLSFDLI